MLIPGTVSTICATGENRRCGCGRKDLHHDGDHGGSEGNVVDEGREDRRGPADEEEGEVLPPLHRHRRHHPAQCVGNEAQQAKFTHALHHHKESSEEEKRVPFNGMQSLVAVMHVEGNQQPVPTP